MPSLVNWLVPAAMHDFALPGGSRRRRRDDADVKYGGWIICALFALTIAITVAGKQLLHMPPVFGMMAGLRLAQAAGLLASAATRTRASQRHRCRTRPTTCSTIIARAEWDTLLFFYGVLVCVGGLATLGFMELASEQLYGGLGFTWANVAMGVLSAIVDNIPIMYAVLQMAPPMDHGQWLLITLTCGVGGSLLSVGSAAGVALMGVSQGQYTFFGHLRWTWAIALGYIASILVHSVGECRPLRQHPERMPCAKSCWSSSWCSFNGFFSMSEMAVMTSRKGRLKELARDSPRRAQGARTGRAPGRLPVGGAGLDHPAQPGHRLCRRRVHRRQARRARSRAHLPLLAEYAQPISTSIGFLLMVFLSVVIGELVPKRLGTLRPERVASLVALPMHFFATIARPGRAAAGGDHAPDPAHARAWARCRRRRSRKRKSATWSPKATNRA